MAEDGKVVGSIAPSDQQTASETQTASAAPTDQQTASETPQEQTASPEEAAIAAAADGSFVQALRALPTFVQQAAYRYAAQADALAETLQEHEEAVEKASIAIAQSDNAWRFIAAFFEATEAAAVAQMTMIGAKRRATQAIVAAFVANGVTPATSEEIEEQFRAAVEAQKARNQEKIDDLRGEILSRLGRNLTPAEAAKLVQ